MDKTFSKQEYRLDGKLITSSDPATIGPTNFRQLTNLRYKATNPQGIGGMSKINTTGLTPKPNIRSLFHFRKDQPAEAYVIAQAWNATLDESALYRNATAIPSQGNFTATTLLDESADSEIGCFAMGPIGNTIYCNKKGAYIWGGDETRLGAFINYAPDDSFRYDFTEPLRDSIDTGSAHLATLERVSETIDSTTTLLMHFANNTTDSSASSHTVVNTACTTTTRVSVFGGSSSSLDGSSSYLRVADKVGWKFTGGNFAIDARIRVASAATLNPIYHQFRGGVTGVGAATNDIKFFTDGDGRLRFHLKQGAASSSVDLRSPTGAIAANYWQHVEVNESGDNYYLFIDGRLKATTTSSIRPRDYRSSLDLGWDKSNFYSGFLDEYRISKTTRHTADFELPATAYSGSVSYKTYFYIGSTRPLQGFKTYIKTANTAVDVAVDADTNLLLHFDGTNNSTTFTDSSNNAHTVTASMDAKLSTSQSKFGTASGAFDGTGDFISIPDSADWNMGTGKFTIDFWVRFNDVSASVGLFNQYDDEDNRAWMIWSFASGTLAFFIADTGTITVTVNPLWSPSVDTWYHIALIRGWGGNDNDWAITVDGTQIGATVTDADDWPELSGDFDIGRIETAVASTFLDGYIDEFRVSKGVARWTANFTPPTRAYPYIGTGGGAAVSSSLMSVDYWSGSQWVTVSSLSDNTSSGDISLAQTGTVTFTSTEAVAKQKVIDGAYIYFYRVRITDCDDTTSLYQVTLTPPMQTIKDAWDGIERTILSFQKYTGTTYQDLTKNVFQDDYDSLNSATYTELDSLSSSNHILCGFGERVTGISFQFVSGKVNTTANTIASVYYWDGASWTSVGELSDGTSENGISFSRSGTISWNAPDEGTEFEKIVTAAQSSAETPLYYYKIQFSKTFSADVQVYYISSIPAQTTINPYAFPMFAINRVWLLSEVDKYKNKALVSSFDTAEVFNGDGAYEFFFGDDSELIAGAPLYLQLGSNVYQAAVICKKSETWIVIESQGEFYQFPVSNVIGCVAPLTMKNANISSGDIVGNKKEVVIWQGAEGIYLFDGKTPEAIHEDIEDCFDKRNSYSINRAKIDKSSIFIDVQNKEAHWLYTSQASTNTLDKEMVLDLQKRKWYEIDRTTGNRLQCGCEAIDTSGNAYNYGAKARYIMRLEHGNSFDGTPITHTMWPGDVVLNDGSISDETVVRVLQLIAKAKKETNNNISCSYYKDGSSTVDQEFTLSPRASGKRIARPLQQMGNEGPATFHSLKMECSTDNEVIGFEPMFMSFFYKPVRQRTYGGT